MEDRDGRREDALCPGSRLTELPASDWSSGQRSQLEGRCVGSGPEEAKVFLSGRFLSEETAKASLTSSTTWTESPLVAFFSLSFRDEGKRRDGS